MSVPAFVYSPFARAFHELDARDLAALVGTEEGWYVEYKSRLPDLDNGAKSISAFANTYGGWIIYGVSAPQRIPEAFPGIEESEVGDLLERLQRAAAVKVTPAPFFESRVIVGPDNTTGLPAQRAVVVVRAPPGANAPYVHGNGRIYRRVADASEPKHETDRHLLDLLWERGRQTRSRWEKELLREFPVSESEGDRVFAHIFLAVDPLGERGSRLRLVFDEFVEAMRDGSPESGGLPFDNFFPAADHFVARQVAYNDPFRLGFTWRQYESGLAIITLPLPHHDLNPPVETLAALLHGYENTGTVVDACVDAGLEHGRLVDLSLTPSLLHGVLVRYKRLLVLGELKSDFFAKARLDRIWRTVPFVDVAGYADFVKTHGVPVVQDESQFAPPGVDASTMLRISWAPRDETTEELSITVDALNLFTEVGSALGVPLLLRSLIDEYQALFQRARSMRGPPSPDSTSPTIRHR